VWIERALWNAWLQDTCTWHETRVHEITFLSRSCRETSIYTGAASYV